MNTNVVDSVIFQSEFQVPVSKPRREISSFYLGPNSSPFHPFWPNTDQNAHFQSICKYAYGFFLFFYFFNFEKAKDLKQMVVLIF